MERGRTVNVSVFINSWPRTSIEDPCVVNGDTFPSVDNLYSSKRERVFLVGVVSHRKKSPSTTVNIRYRQRLRVFLFTFVIRTRGSLPSDDGDLGSPRPFDSTPLPGPRDGPSSVCRFLCQGRSRGLSRVVSPPELGKGSGSGVLGSEKKLSQSDTVARTSLHHVGVG